MAFIHRKIPSPVRVAIIAIGALFLLFGGSRAWADPMVSYNLDVSENLNVLLAEGVVDSAPPSALAAAQTQLALAQANAAKATPFQLAVSRNTPYLMLQNISTVANGGTGSADITHFELSIQNTDQTFDWVKLIQASTDPGVTVQFNTPNGVDDNVKNQVVSMDITGLAPGKKLVFQLDLDPLSATGSQFSDYRDVFFKLDSANNNQPNNVAGNATTKAIFFDSSTNTTTPTMDATWQNQDYPDNLGEPIMGLKFPSKPHGDHVQWFPTGDATTATVPEPASLILAGLGGMGLLAWRRFQLAA